jgi:hypothetical protein
MFKDGQSIFFTVTGFIRDGDNKETGTSLEMILARVSFGTENDNSNVCIVGS